MSLAIVRSTTKSKKAATKPKLIGGVNSSEKQQLEGKNEHYRVFELSNSEIEPVSRLSFFDSANRTDVYQRVLRARGGLAAIASGASGKTGFEVKAISTENNQLRWGATIESEAADLDVLDDEHLVYCTDKEIFTVTVSDAKQTKLKLNFPVAGKLRSIRYLTSERILAVVNAPARTGSELVLLDVVTGTAVTRRKLHTGISAVTSLDVVTLSPHSGAVAVAGADQTIELLVVTNDRINTAQIFRNVHPFQITKVAFSPAPSPPPAPSADVEEKEEEAHVVRLASTSIGNTCVVHTLPLIPTKDGYTLLAARTASQTVLTVLLSLITVAVLAVVLQVVFVTRGGLNISELVPHMHMDHLHERPWVKSLEANVDALIAGLKSGAATNPFGENVNEDELREELMAAVKKAAEKVEQVEEIVDGTVKKAEDKIQENIEEKSEL
jgi:hypothetical protein